MEFNEYEIEQMAIESEKRPVHINEKSIDAIEGFREGLSRVFHDFKVREYDSEENASIHRMSNSIEADCLRHIARHYNGKPLRIVLAALEGDVYLREMSAQHPTINVWGIVTGYLFRNACNETAYERSPLSRMSDEQFNAMCTSDGIELDFEKGELADRIRAVLNRKYDVKDS